MIKTSNKAWCPTCSPKDLSAKTEMTEEMACRKCGTLLGFYNPPPPEIEFPPESELVKIGLDFLFGRRQKRRKK